MHTFTPATISQQCFHTCYYVQDKCHWMNHPLQWLGSSIAGMTLQPFLGVSRRHPADCKGSLWAKTPIYAMNFNPSLASGPLNEEYDHKWSRHCPLPVSCKRQKDNQAVQTSAWHTPQRCPAGASANLRNQAIIPKFPNLSVRQQKDPRYQWFQPVQEFLCPRKRLQILDDLDHVLTSWHKTISLATTWQNITLQQTGTCPRATVGKA